jgi:Flp pilus assembly protein TadD
VQARAAFQRALDKDSAQLAALEGLTLLDLQERKSAEARARLEGAIAKAPRSDALYLLAGRTYASLQDPANAEKALTHALELNPNNLQVYAALGQFYVNEKRLPEATTEFEKLAKKQPSSVGPQVALGVLFQLQKRNDEARTRYEKALELDPHASVAANNLAWMYAETETNLDVALRLAQTAKSQLPDVAEVNDTLGWIYQKKGLSSLAIAPLQQSVAKDPGNASYHYHLGLAYAANGQDPKAREALKRAIQLKLTPEETSDAEKQLARLKG